MAISARNKIQRRVSNIKSGEAMCLVTLDAQGTKIVAAVTNEGVEELNLKQRVRSNRFKKAKRWVW